MAIDIPKHKEIFRQRDVRVTQNAVVQQDNFEAADFTVSENLVSLKNVTRYFTVHGSAFNVGDGDGNDPWHTSETGIEAAGGSLSKALAPVQLPDGAVITGAIVYGADSDTWALKRVNMSSGSSDTLASSTFGTEDTTISNATVDNSTYAYFFETGEVADNIMGGRVTYTINHLT